MDRDPYADMFRFQMGQAVRWAEHPGKPHYVHQRRWTQRQILEPVVEYRISLWQGDDAASWGSWVHDHDIEPWPEG